MALNAQEVHGFHVSDGFSPPGFWSLDESPICDLIPVAIGTLCDGLIALHFSAVAMAFNTSLVPSEPLCMNLVVEYRSRLIHVPMTLEAGGILVQGHGEVVTGLAGPLFAKARCVVVMIEKDHVPIPVGIQQKNPGGTQSRVTPPGPDSRGAPSTAGADESVDTPGPLHRHGNGIDARYREEEESQNPPRQGRYRVAPGEAQGAWQEGSHGL